MSIAILEPHGASAPPTRSMAEGARRRGAYHAALDALTSGLRSIVGPAVRQEDARLGRRYLSADPARRVTELAAAQALAVFAGRTFLGDATLRDQVRSVLVRWQLSLFGDGRPACGAQRHSGYRAACAGFVARILAGGVSYETPVIVSDLARHLQWLWGRRDLPLWSQAVLIDAACETALIARDGALLHQARRRLADLLSRQNEEGWFDDHRACALVEQSFVLDALTRVYSQTTWPELENSLRRGLRFVSHFSGVPRGSLFRLSAIPFYAAESQPQFEVGLVAAARRAAAQLQVATRHGAPDLDVALASASMSLAGTVVDPAAEIAPTRSEDTSPAEIARGGFLIHRNRHLDTWVDVHRGGAIAALWRASAAEIEDDLTVLVRGGLARSTPAGGPLQPQRASGTFVYRGEISLVDQPLLRERPRPRGALAFLGAPRPLGTHHREIAIDGDTLSIKDQVWLRHRALAIVLGTTGGESPSQPIALGGVKEMELSRVYRDGELLELRRDTR